MLVSLTLFHSEKQKCRHVLCEMTVLNRELIFKFTANTDMVLINPEFAVPWPDSLWEDALGRAL